MWRRRSRRTCAPRASSSTRLARWSTVRRSSGRVLAALLASRIVIEAAAFSCLFAIANAFTGAVGTVSLVVLCAGLVGVSCVLVAALRDTATERAGGAIIGATLVGSLA